MRIDFHGRLVDEPEIKVGFIGCGSHSFRNVYPAFQFAPVKLTAACDLIIEKAEAFAEKFGAKRAYSDYSEMLEKEDLDAVFVVTGYDTQGRPLYPAIAIGSLDAGVNVWIEKPPAAACKDVERMQAAAVKAGKQVMVGFKKMFFPANEKAKELMDREDFGRPSMAMIQYPQYVPTTDEFQRYVNKKEKVNSVVGFLDHLCHPVSLMLFLLGMPETLYYERAGNGAGSAVFKFGSGAICSIALTHGASRAGGIERTVVISDSGKHVVVDNNIRVSYHRSAPYPEGQGYGNAPTYYFGAPDEATAEWEPEFSLGQLYNKGLFVLGYYGEVNEFARAIIEKRPVKKGTLEHAWQATRIFEAFTEGPGKTIQLG